MDRLRALLDDQAGVLSRGQALAAGLAPHDVRRLLRRRDLTRVHPGVYVDHSGPLSWRQRAWAAVLAMGESALSHESAMRAAEGPGRRAAPSPDAIQVPIQVPIQAPIQVAIDRRRSSPVPPAGVVVHHVTALREKVLWNTSPPRMRYEEAALDVALAAEDPMARIAALANACQARRTTADRLLASLGARARVPSREWIAAVLADVRDGTNSVLEHAYLRSVERPHGLPHAHRQVLASTVAGRVARDVVYRFGVRAVIVELDGRMFHDTVRARDRDLDRDLVAAAGGQETIRLSWGQVLDRPCLTAARVSDVLRINGWSGGASPCGPTCTVPRIGVSR